MTGFRSFYFFHIPKTIDPVFDVSVIRPLYASMAAGGIDASANHDFADHCFWRDPSPETYVLCFVRDPVRRTAAEFCYATDFGELNVEKRNQRFINQPNEMHTLDLFEHWLHNFHTPNYQTMLTNGCETSSSSMAIKRLSSVRLACRVERMNTGVSYPEWADNAPLKLVNKIIDDLALGPKVCHVPLFTWAAYYDFVSTDLVHKLVGSSLMTQVEEMNREDMNLYHQGFYFM